MVDSERNKKSMHQERVYCTILTTSSERVTTARKKDSFFIRLKSKQNLSAIPEGNF
jgi:hypothetical protein